VGNARALLLLTSSDVVNLEAALQGRALRDDLRVVLRLFDDDLAERVERVLGIAISRSVSRLAASAFAAAVVERQVIGTMSIGRAVLLIADVPVVAGSPLAGQPLSVANEPGEARVIALRQRGADSRDDLNWTPRAAELLAPQDRLIVVATRAGLGRLLARSIAPITQPDAS
jgi:Trk K+ transport system NAD-binding subunit